MAITYNAYGSNLSHIYQDDGGSFSANQVAASAFDYFPDDAAVGDALYFGGPGTAAANRTKSWRNLKLYVGTAFAATSVTFVWEYWDGNSWETLSNVIDNTNDFSTTGENTVTWDMPELWGYNTVNGANTHWVRCRITAIDTPTEGGAQSTQAVEAGDNTIIVTGTGNDFDDILTADVAGSWDVFTEPVSNVYKCLAMLHIGDGSTTTTFSDTEKIVYMYWFWKVTAAATITFGQLETIGGNKGWDGCHFYHCQYGWDTRWTDFSGTHNFYGCTLNALTTGDSDIVFNAGTTTLYDTDIVGVNIGPNFAGGTITLVRGFFAGRSYSVSFNVIGTYTDCQFVNVHLTKNNLIFDGATGSKLNVSGFTGGRIFYLVDSTFNSFAYSGHAGTELDIYVKYRFDLKVVDNNGDGISGVTVTIDDSEGTEVFSGSTDGSGDITQQQLVKELREATRPDPETVTSKTPHTVTISKAGYATRTIKYTMSKKREEIEKLTADGTSIISSTIHTATIY